MPKKVMGWEKRVKEKEEKTAADAKLREQDAHQAAQILMQQQMAAMMNKGGAPWGDNMWPTSEDETWKRPRPPSGPKLPRESVDLPPVTGEVLEWKGKFGWIMPSTHVHHPLARKHGGKIYISCSDLEGDLALQTGDVCEFTLYSDSSGLGAGHCKKLGAGLALSGGSSAWASSQSSAPWAGNSGHAGDSSTWAGDPSAWAADSAAWASNGSSSSTAWQGGGSPDDMSWAGGNSSEGSPGSTSWAVGGSSAAWAGGDSSGAAWPGSSASGGGGGGSGAWAGGDASQGTAWTGSGASGFAGW